MMPAIRLAQIAQIGTKYFRKVLLTTIYAGIFQQVSNELYKRLKIWRKTVGLINFMEHLRSL